VRETRCLNDNLVLHKSGEEKTLHRIFIFYRILSSKAIEGQSNRTRAITPKVGPKNAGKNGFESPFPAAIVFGLRILPKENFDFKHLGRFLSTASFPCNDATIALFCRQPSAHEEHSFQKKDGVIRSYDLAQDHFFQ